MSTLTFVDMFSELCKVHGAARVADGIGCSIQYVSDMRRGMRLPSVRITEAICEWMGRGPKGCAEWHRAAARAHGWNV